MHKRTLLVLTAAVCLVLVPGAAWAGDPTVEGVQDAVKEQVAGQVEDAGKHAPATPVGRCCKETPQFCKQHRSDSGKPRDDETPREDETPRGHQGPPDGEDPPAVVTPVTTPGPSAPAGSSTPEPGTAVVETPAAEPGVLPFTGSTSLPLLVVGVSLLATGSLALRAGRHRSRVDHR